MTIHQELKVSPLQYYGAQFPELAPQNNKAMVRCAFHNERTPSMLLDLANGRFKCFGCGLGGDIVDFHQRASGLDFKAALAELGGENWTKRSTSLVEPAPPIQRSYASPSKLQSIWDNASRITASDPAGKYLMSRGLSAIAIGVLRYCQSLPYYNSDKELIGCYPAMVAAIQHESGAVVALHRTYLTLSGEKLSLRHIDGFRARKIYGPTIANGLDGSAIRLHKPGSVLAVGEGIETALSYSRLFDVPAWATVTSNGLLRVQIPDTVETVHICQDNDEAGRKASEALANRLKDLGKTVIRNPLPEAWSATKGADFNDVLMEKNREQH